MIRTVVHVGAHKTATSLIQKYFRDRPSVTRALKLGFIGRDETNALIGWGKHIVEQPDLLRHRIEKELERSPAAVFVSHENTLGPPVSPDRPGLYPIAKPRAKALMSALTGLDLRVVFYVRPVSSFVESYYVQTVQQGKSHTFDEWYSKLNPSSLRWTPLVETLDDTFGSQRVAIGDFNEITEGQEEFLTRFMLRSGLPVPPAVSYRPRRNPSISRRGLEIALRINPYLETSRERRATRDFLQRRFNNTTDERARPMPDSVRANLDANTAGEYVELARRSEIALKEGMRDAVFPSRVRWARVEANEKALRLANQLRSGSERTLKKWLT